MQAVCVLSILNTPPGIATSFCLEFRFIDALRARLESHAKAAESYSEHQHLTDSHYLATM